MFSRLVVVAAASVLLGCGNQRAEIDSLVEEVWIEINQDQQIDAVEYLANGGRHYDPGLSAQPDDVDRTVILPLMKRLKDEFKAQPWAHIQPNEGDYAWTFCVRLPAGGAGRSGILRPQRRPSPQRWSEPEAQARHNPTFSRAAQRSANPSPKRKRGKAAKPRPQGPGKSRF